MHFCPLSSFFPLFLSIVDLEKRSIHHPHERLMRKREREYDRGGSLAGSVELRWPGRAAHRDDAYHSLCSEGRYRGFFKRWVNIVHRLLRDVAGSSNDRPASAISISKPHPA